MIAYEEGGCGILFACSLKGSVLPRAFLWGIASSIVAVAIQILLEELESDRSDEPSWRDDVANDVLKGFTFAMGFALVMRTQKAYTRWWEGGTLLEQVRGEWFNAISSLIAFGNQDPSKLREVEKLNHQLIRLFSLLYGNALLQVSTMSNNMLEYIDLDGFDAEDIDHMKNSHDTCELVLQWIQRIIVDSSNHELIKIAPPILSRVYNQLGNGIVRLNNARKIRDFPVPFPLAQIVTFMLLIHWGTTVVVCAVTISSYFMAAVCAFAVTTPLWGINYMSVELENPFGNDANDLPLHTMQCDMNKSLLSLLHPRTIKPPTFTYIPERDTELRIKVLDFGASWSGTANKYGFLHKVSSHLNHSGTHSNVPKEDSGAGATMDTESPKPAEKQIVGEHTQMAAPPDFNNVSRPDGVEVQIPSGVEMMYSEHHLKPDSWHACGKATSIRHGCCDPNEEVPHSSQPVSCDTAFNSSCCEDSERLTEKVQSRHVEEAPHPSQPVSLGSVFSSGYFGDKEGLIDKVQSRHLKQAGGKQNLDDAAPFKHATDKEGAHYGHAEPCMQKTRSRSR